MEAVVDFFKDMLLPRITFFVAIDAVGALPIFLALTEGMERREQSKILRYAMLTALGLGLAFVGLGKAVLKVLSISTSHLLVAGGLILLLPACRNLLMGERREATGPEDRETIGVFPIGIPLLVGPAVLTTLLVLIDRYSVAPVLVAFLLNVACAWLRFSQSARIARLLGRGGLGAASKIAMLLLAAIAVRMIHRGILQVLEGDSGLL